MTMMKFNPTTPFADLFEDLFGKESTEKMDRRNYECAPSTNILESTENFQLQMAVPGVNKKDIKIDLEKNVLNISSEKSAQEKDNDDIKFTRREFLYGTFCRSFTLPETIDVDKISADVKDGILTVTLPKKEETRVSKEIKIS